MHRWKALFVEREKEDNNVMLFYLLLCSNLIPFYHLFPIGIHTGLFFKKKILFFNSIKGHITKSIPFQFIDYKCKASARITQTN